MHDAPSPDLKHELETLVRAELGLEVQSWARLSGGAQNRLFALATPAIDRWPRLATEFSTIHALNSYGLQRVPQSLPRDDARSFAVFPPSLAMSAAAPVCDSHFSSQWVPSWESALSL